MSYYPPISPYAAGIGGKCPRCGQGALFKSFLGLAEKCPACGLDYAKADAGDGPAVFVIFIVGFAAVALAFVLQFVFYVPIIVAFVLSAAFAVALSIALLRPLKATMIALQYKHKAEEGRLQE